MMDGALVQAIAIGGGIAVSTLGAGLAMVFKMGRVEGRTCTKLETLSTTMVSHGKKIDELTTGVGECASRISTVEGYIKGKRNNRPRVKGHG